MSDKLKVRKNKPKKSEVAKEIEEFFTCLRVFFKDKDSLIKAACSDKLKVRERAQYVLLGREKFLGPLSDATSLTAGST